MRKLRFAVAAVAAALALVGATIGVGSAAQPAQAQADQPPSGVPLPGDVVLPPPGPSLQLGLAILNTYRGGPTPANLAELVSAAASLLEGLQDRVTDAREWNLANRSLEAADALFTRYLANGDMPPEWSEEWRRWAWADFAADATASAYDDNAHVRTFTSRRALDAVGFALNSKYPMALEGARDAGSSQNAQRLVLQKHIEANEMLVDKLVPTCDAWSETEPFIETVTTYHTCTAANGETASDYEIYDIRAGTWTTERVNVNQLKVNSAIHSSWLDALGWLPILRQM